MTLPTIDVTYHFEQGQWWAESADVEGFVASAENLSDLRELVRGGLPFYLDLDAVELAEGFANGQPVATSSWQSVYSVSAFRMPSSTTSSSGLSVGHQVLADA